MPAYIASKQTIAFEDTPRTSLDWIRLDCDESGVTVDRGGLCRLSRADCLQLAAWLLSAADRLPSAAPAPPKLSGRKAKPAGGRHQSRAKQGDAA
jgi:hypothetical protein